MDLEFKDKKTVKTRYPGKNPKGSGGQYNRNSSGLWCKKNSNALLVLESKDNILRSHCFSSPPLNGKHKKIHPIL